MRAMFAVELYNENIEAFFHRCVLRWTMCVQHSVLRHGDLGGAVLCDGALLMRGSAGARAPLLELFVSVWPECGRDAGAETIDEQHAEDS